MDTTESGDPLSRIAQRLHRPVASLPAFALLDRAAQQALLDALEQALTRRESELDRALSRLLPRALRRWLAR